VRAEDGVLEFENRAEPFALSLAVDGSRGKEPRHQPAVTDPRPHEPSNQDSSTP
jgi:hypothetical protein